jgi:hypothetical protein
VLRRGLLGPPARQGTAQPLGVGWDAVGTVRGAGKAHGAQRCNTSCVSNSLAGSCYRHRSCRNSLGCRQTGARTLRFKRNGQETRGPGLEITEGVA